MFKIVCQCGSVKELKLIDGLIEASGFEFHTNPDGLIRITCLLCDEEISEY